MRLVRIEAVTGGRRDTEDLSADLAVNTVARLPGRQLDG